LEVLDNKSWEMKAYVLVRRLAIAVASLFEWPTFRANRVIVHGYTFETADGEIRYYAEVNTTRVAHENRDELVAVIQESSRRLFATLYRDTGCVCDRP
jgi:hypothetical protein